MGFTFRKRFKIMDGLYLNLGKKSASITTKVGRVSHTRSTTGRSTTSVDLPGPLGYRKTTRRRKNTD
jgi:hypothetical protein